MLSETSPRTGYGCDCKLFGIMSIAADKNYNTVTVIHTTSGTFYMMKMLSMTSIKFYKA